MSKRDIQVVETVLASFDRKGDGQPASMRIAAAVSPHFRLVNLRKWVDIGKGRNHNWIPTREGVTIALTEIDAAIRALEKAREILMADPEPATPTRPTAVVEPELACVGGPKPPWED